MKIQLVLRDNSFQLVNELKTMNIFCLLCWQLGTKNCGTRVVLPLHMVLDKQAFKDSCHGEPETVQISCEHYRGNYLFTGYFIECLIHDQDLKQSDGLVGTITTLSH